MKENTKGKKIILGVSIGLLLLVAGIYAGIAFYFTTHFYTGTTINGMDCSKMTVKEVKEEIQKGILTYHLTIQERDNQQEAISAEQMGFKYVDTNEVEAMLKEQQAYLWFIKGFAHENFKISVSSEHDEELVISALENLKFYQDENQTAPRDAYIEEGEDSFTIIPEVVGNTIDKEKAKQAVLDAVNNQKTELSLEDAGAYLSPKVYSNDEKLIAQAESLNRLTTAEITFDFVDSKKVVDRQTIRDMLIEGTDGEYVLSEELVAAWVEEMAKETDTFGLTHEFKTFAGDTITLNGGDYGWAMDMDATTAKLTEALQAGSVETMEPEYVFTAKDRSSNDIGDTYVEISITEQRMWCYKDGELIVDTPVVTGNSAKGWDTPKGGVWAIDAQKRNAILKGEGYASPVDYWLPFNGDVGIHDLNRPEFGGEIYKTNGSHGCVNTPHAEAEKIYEAVDIGTPVIVY